MYEASWATLFTMQFCKSAFYFRAAFYASINKEVLKAAPAGGRASFALSGRGVNTLGLNEGLCWHSLYGSGPPPRGLYGARNKRNNQDATRAQTRANKGEQLRTAVCCDCDPIKILAVVFLFKNTPCTSYRVVKIHCENVFIFACHWTETKSRIAFSWKLIDNTKNSRNALCALRDFLFALAMIYPLTSLNIFPLFRIS